MRKYHGMRILILCFCILISVSGCSVFRQTKTCTTFSDASRNISFVSGSELNSMGIVLDNREFLQCDYEGSVMNDVVFDTDISFLDMWGYYVLIGFEDNHIEIYYMDSDETQKLCEYSFDNEISQVEDEIYNAEVKIAETLDVNYIKKIAVGKLGMVEPDDSQLMYISVPNEDYTVNY